MPASAGAIRAGQAFVELFADDSKLVKGLSAAGKRLKTWGAAISGLGRKMGAAGMGIVAPLVAAAKMGSDAGSRLWDMSKRTGLAVETLSLFDYAAAQTDTTLEAVEGAVKRMQKSISGAADEAEGTTGKLDHLGIAAETIVGLPVEEQFGRIAGALRGIQDPTARAAAAMKVFGRSGTKMLPMLDDFERLQSEAGAFGLIKTAESAREAKEFTHVLELGARVMKSMWTAVGSAVMPILKEKTERITRFVVLVRDWIKQNSGLVQSIFKIGLVLVGVGAGLVVLGKVVALGGTLFGVLATAIGAVGSVLAFLVSPIGLVIAAITGLGGLFLWLSGTGEAALTWLADLWKYLKDIALKAWKGISDALAAGDLALAGKVALSALKVYWVDFSNWLRGLWLDFKGFWRSITDWIAKMFLEGVALIERTWARALGWMKKQWEKWSTSGFEEWLGRQIAYASAIATGASRKEADERAEMVSQDMKAKRRKQGQTLDQIDAETEAQVRGIDETLRVELAAIDSENAAAARARQKQLAGAQADADAAREEFQKALDEAAAKRAAMGEAGPPARPKMPGGPAEALDLTGKGKVAGTFSAFIAARLGGSGQAWTAADVRRLLMLNENQLKAIRKTGLGFT